MPLTPEEFQRFEDLRWANEARAVVGLPDSVSSGATEGEAVARTGCCRSTGPVRIELRGAVGLQKLDDLRLGCVHERIIAVAGVEDVWSNGPVEFDPGACCAPGRDILAKVLCYFPEGYVAKEFRAG